MKKLFLSLAALIACCHLVVEAGLTARSKMQLAARPAATSAIVLVDNDAALAAIERQGGRVHSVAGNIATVTLPQGQAARLAAIQGVKSLALAQRLHLCNDTARAVSRADSVLISGHTRTPYDGTGVVVGVIDVGFDFNHINFKDEHGVSRVKRVYLPCDDSGEAPEVEGRRLPGSHYTTAAQIATLTTDDNRNSHGTHTTGTAAGSYRGNGLHGVAAGADLVLCGMPDDSLTDAHIIDCVKYVFDYATSVRRPAVVNMSLGSHDGAHNGSSLMCRALDQLTGPGRLVVLSAGNDGAIPCHIEHSMASPTDTLRTFLGDWTTGTGVLNGSASAWSATAQPHTVRIAVVEPATGATLMQRELSLSEDVLTISSDDDAEWARFFTGTLRAAAAVDDNDRYHSVVDLQARAVERGGRYQLGLKYVAAQPETLSLWTSVNTFFYHYNLNGWTPGTSVGSISDLATGQNTISVGSYCSKNNIRTQWGVVLSWAKSRPFDIAHFSSRGPDMNGQQRPDVLAPGFSVVSSVSRYDEASAMAHSRRVQEVTVDGEVYPYGAEMGTSMSTPVVTGAAALWLQANPQLTPAQAREVLRLTSVKDGYYAWMPENQRGNGKLDVTASLRQVAMDVGDVNGDGLVNGSDVTGLYNILLDEESTQWFSPMRVEALYDVLLR